MVMLGMAEIETSRFISSSVRAARASKTKAVDVLVTCIMKKAGWSGEATFAKFYDKCIARVSDPF